MKVDIGVIQRQIQLQQQARLTTHAAAFGEAVVRKYAEHTLTASGTELALAHAQQPIHVAYQQSNSRIDITPEFTIHEHHPFREVTREIGGTHAAPPEYRHPEARVFFERVLARQSRVPVFLPAEHPSPRPNDLFAPIIRKLERAEGPGSVNRELPRPSGSPETTGTPATAKAHSAINHESDWGTPDAIPLKPAPAAFPAPEIKRVADQVIRELDHRLLAHRERMGRRG